MFDFLQLFYEIRHKPIGFIVLAVSIFIADRLGRKFITHQVKRLFNVNEKHDLAAYEARQIHIEKMVEELLRREGIECDIKHTAVRQKKSTVMSLGTSSTLFLVKTIKERMKNMSRINRGILLPLLSAIALFVKQVWGYEISDEQINMYADLILYVLMFTGLFIAPRKERPKNDTMDFTDNNPSA